MTGSRCGACGSETEGPGHCGACAEADWRGAVAPQGAGPAVAPPDFFFVFDVESVGLHGEGFAVGLVVTDRRGARLHEAEYSCRPEAAGGVRDAGQDPARGWLAANVPPLGYTCDSPAAVREEFWGEWLAWKGRGAVMVADCGWPVEARFLAACVDQEMEGREWGGPYPLHELASLRLAAGLDPLAAPARLADELPAHNPLCDARQSSRLLAEALRRLHPTPGPE